MKKPASQEPKPRRSLPRRLARGSMLGLAFGFGAAVLLFIFGSEQDVASDAAVEVSGSYWPEWMKPNTLMGLLIAAPLYVMGFLGMIAVAVGGASAGDHLWPGAVGGVGGAVVAYALAWMVAGAIWGAVAGR